MLHIETPFPNPGSIALFLGLRWRVNQHNADGTALIAREGLTASLTRRAPIEDLVDPGVADDNMMVSLTDMSEATARIAIHATTLLRDINEIGLRPLGAALQVAANEGRIPHYTDNSHLVRVMRRLGWRKDGYVGEGIERSPLYRRVATTDQIA